MALDTIKLARLVRDAIKVPEDMKTNIHSKHNHHAELIPGDEEQNLQATERIAQSVTEQLQAIHDQGGTRTSELYVETRENNLIVNFYSIMPLSDREYRSVEDIRRETGTI
jgi:hypothetical protein